MSSGNVILSCIVPLLIAIVASLASQFHKTALTGDLEHFSAPFGFTVFGILFLIPLYPMYLVIRVMFTNSKASEIHSEAMKILKNEKGIRYPMWKLMNGLTLAMYFWVSPMYLFGVALKYVSVSVCISVMSLNSAMVFVISIFWLGTQFSWFKAVGILLSIGGVIFMSLDSKFTGNVVGVLIILVAALFGALYTTCFKKILGEPSLSQIMFLLSLLGLTNLIYNTVPAALMVHFGYEHVEWQYIPWGPIFGQITGMLMYTLLVNIGVSLLNPLVVSIGVLGGIPMTAAIDILFRGLQASSSFYIGGVLISIGFCLTTLPLDEWWGKWRTSSTTSTA